MKRWALRVSVVLSALAVALTVTWWGWRARWSAEQFRVAVAEAIKTGDFSRAERLKEWGADNHPPSNAFSPLLPRARNLV